MTSHLEGDTLGAILARWTEVFPDSRPLDHDAHWPEDRRLVIHSLPKSKRYPEIAVEYAELLHRHLTLLEELVGDGGDRTVAVITRSWSDTPEPVRREAWLDRMVPAVYIRSDLTDPEYKADPLDPDDHDFPETWEHSWGTSLSIGDPALVVLLALISNDQVGPVHVLPRDLAWSYQPYDGGAHVVTRSSDQAAALTSTHSAWLPIPESEWPSPGKSALEDEPTWQLNFGNLSRADAERILDSLEERGLVPSWAQLVDPQRDLTIQLDRSAAQALRAALSAEGGEVFEVDQDKAIVLLPQDAKLRLLGPLGLGDQLDEFLDDYGYRPPAEAIDG